ncbi:MAG TPA: GNAT family N-acetyltransferase [Bdellovibrionales bacterium]|nr:GNAT family N-acetyltransferase [Bdellovibrionales bacterium]
MWLEATRFPATVPVTLRLERVETEADWEAMYALRLQIEKPFGNTNPRLVEGFVEDIRKKARALDGSWFLARAGSDIVGEIGLVPFELAGVRFGRLQDVDIAPQWQGRGLGRELLSAVCQVARDMELSALALRARSDGWVKDWYARFGFRRVDS